MRKRRLGSHILKALALVVVLTGCLSACNVGLLLGWLGLMPVSSTRTAVEVEEQAVPVQVEGPRLGPVVSASNVDRDGCPARPMTVFPADTTVLYVVASNSEIPAGTEVFVRYYLNGTIYEESSVIVADTDYHDVCVNFTLEVDAAPRLRAGDYTAEFVVNGDVAGSVNFVVE